MATTETAPTAGFSSSDEDEEKTTAELLFAAARDGDLAALDALLPNATADELHEGHAFDFNGTSSDVLPVTPLFAAAFGGYEDCVRRLIAAGADVDRGCSEGTPLMAAAASRKDCDSCAAALLKAGADVNHEVRHTDDNGYLNVCRAIHVVTNCSCAATFVHLLISHGANLDTPAVMGSDELSPLFSACDDNSMMLIGGGADADARRRFMAHKHSVIFILLRAGADCGHLFEERPHLTNMNLNRPAYLRAYDRPLAERLPTDQHRAYFRTVRTAGGFAAYARARQCQLRTIKLFARGHGRLNLPEALIPTIVSYWDKPWVPSFPPV